MHGGGQAYTYDTPGGTTTMAVPPRGFHPLTASAAELAEYGFPQEPAEADQQAEWVEAMSAWKTRVTPDLCFLDTSVDPDLATQNVSYVSSSNWSGYVAQPDSGASFTQVWGSYYQPSRLTTSCSGARESVWAGLGGDASSSRRSDGTIGLLQAGTSYNSSGSPMPWYEYLYRNASRTWSGLLTEASFAPNFSVAPGDHIFTETEYNPSTGKALFYVENETTGEDGSANPAISSNFYDGSIAEWITERPAMDGPTGALYPLQNYGTVTWTGAQVENSSGHAVFLGSTHAQIAKVMEDSASTVLSDPSSIGGPSGGQFSTTFFGCS